VSASVNVATFAVNVMLVSCGETGMGGPAVNAASATLTVPVVDVAVLSASAVSVTVTEAL
jgi:hypothetical protein